MSNALNNLAEATLRLTEKCVEKFSEYDQHIESLIGHKKVCIADHQSTDSRIEKMEKALSQEMAKVREMDDILAGVVKRVGYVSEAPYPAERYIHKYDIIAWLDMEIAMAAENLEQAEKEHMVVATAKMQAMLATYRAVKAHIEG